MLVEASALRNPFVIESGRAGEAEPYAAPRAGSRESASIAIVECVDGEGDAFMATLTVRNLAPETRKALKERAARNDRSMEAEARAILEDAVGRPNHIANWLVSTESLRCDDLALPERSAPREVDLA